MHDIPLFLVQSFRHERYKESEPVGKQKKVE